VITWRRVVYSWRYLLSFLIQTQVEAWRSATPPPVASTPIQTLLYPLDSKLRARKIRSRALRRAEERFPLSGFESKFPTLSSPWLRREIYYAVTISAPASLNSICEHPAIFITWNLIWFWLPMHPLLKLFAGSPWSSCFTVQFVPLWSVERDEPWLRSWNEVDVWRDNFRLDKAACLPVHR